MASYVLLLKEKDDEESVIYKFGPNELNMGKIMLNKKTMIFTEIEPVHDELIKPKFYFDRAALKITKYFSSGRGFPDKASFES
jgi:hypothetical protein